MEPKKTLFIKLRELHDFQNNGAIVTYITGTTWVNVVANDSYPGPREGVVENSTNDDFKIGSIVNLKLFSEEESHGA